MPGDRTTFVANVPAADWAVPLHSPGYQPSRVAYFFHEAMGELYYASGHPMKPHRQTMTNSLVVEYGLHRRCEFFRPRQATKRELNEFHAEDYTDFLQR